MKKQTKQQLHLARLRSLANQPDERASYALELLEKERGSSIVSEALDVISTAAMPEARPVLLQLYNYYDAVDVNRDTGGSFRIALLAALMPIAKDDDQALAERAITTYEFHFQDTVKGGKREENASGLRAAGLVLLNNIDPTLASYHCVQLLNGPYTSLMSGEPAVSAVRILANQGHFLPLYTYISNAQSRLDIDFFKYLIKAPALVVDGRFSQHYQIKRDAEFPAEITEFLKYLTAFPASTVDIQLARHYQAKDNREMLECPEVITECLRQLPRLSLPAMDALFVQYYRTQDDMELTGFFDLLLKHVDVVLYRTFIHTFLKTTQRYEVYRYLVTTIIAEHSPEVWPVLLEVARSEQDRYKIEILLSALVILESDQNIANIVCDLQKRQ